MKNNAAKIRYHSNLEQPLVLSKHNRYLSNLTKNTYDSFDKQQFLSYHDELRSKNMSFSRDKDSAQSEELQRQFKSLLQSVQKSMETSQWMSKHQRIRINQWLVKLTYKQLNPVWKKNVNFYLAVLLEMMHHQKIGQPFMNLPNDGPLPKLSVYDVPYPIRQKFAQSKEKNQKRSDLSKGSKDEKQVANKRKVSVGKKQILKANYEVSILEKNSSWFENNHSSKYTLQQSQFEAQPFDLKMQLKPVFSNGKTRKNTINRINQNSNKTSDNKDKSKANTAKRIKDDPIILYDYDKQNHIYAININRQLFKSKEKQSQQEPNKQNYFEIDMTAQNQPQKLAESRMSECSKTFLKASEQIRSKFKQTDNQTLQFMSFLNKLKQKDRRI